MLVSSIDIFCLEFYGLSTNQESMDIIQFVRNARLRVQSHPEAARFYQKWRERESCLKSTFISIEERFRENLRKLFPTFDDVEILMVHACIHGLVTSPFLEPAQTEQICRLLIKKNIFEL